MIAKLQLITKIRGFMCVPDNYFQNDVSLSAAFMFSSFSVSLHQLLIYYDIETTH